MIRKNVLIIEDEGDLRDAMVAAFVNHDYVVAAADNGNIGYEKAITLEPSIILLDLVMPIETGQHMLDRLAAHPWGSTAKVVVLTAHDPSEFSDQLNTDLVVDYILKSSMSLEEIIARVDTHIAPSLQT